MMHERLEFEVREQVLMRRLRLGLGVLVGTAFSYVVLVFILGAADVRNLLDLLDPSRVASAIALVLLGLTIRAARWCYFLRTLRLSVPLVPSLVAFVSSFALTATPGKAGELIKSMLLRARYNVPISQTAGILVVERLSDLIALLLLGAIGLAVFVNIDSYLLLCALIVVGIYALLQSPTLLKRVVTPITKFVAVRPLISRLSNLYRAASRLLRPAPFFTGTALAVAAWSCEGLALYTLTASLPIEISLQAAVSIFALSSIAGALSMLPGGLGGFEAAMILLFVQLGATPAIAAVVAVAFRLCTLYFATALGFASLAIWRLMPMSSLERSTQEPRYPATPSFDCASVILPVVDETSSLRQTVDEILEGAGSDICQLLIVVCERTTKQSLDVVRDLRKRLGSLVVVHHQSLPFLGGAIREAFALARGSHVVMMASDLETDPRDVKRLIEKARQNPNAIITASRWCAGGAFNGYDPKKLFANRIFQAFFSMLYATRLSDMTYGYRLFPRNLVQNIKWEELRHAFLFETIVKPLRLGVPVVEIPSVWRARREGKSQNTLLQNFVYFRTGLRTRFARRSSLLLNKVS